MKSTSQQTIDRGLFIYGGLVAVTLTAVSLINLKGINSLVTFVLFLPVSIYFIIQAFVIIGNSIHRFINSNSKRHPYFGEFKLHLFINQADTLFLITIFLISLATAITLFKISLNIIK